MKKVSFAVIGLGNRGWVYASHVLKFPQDMEIAAVDLVELLHFCNIVQAVIIMHKMSKPT